MVCDSSVSLDLHSPWVRGINVNEFTLKHRAEGGLYAPWGARVLWNM